MQQQNLHTVIVHININFTLYTVQNIVHFIMKKDTIYNDALKNAIFHLKKTYFYNKIEL